MTFLASIRSRSLESKAGTARFGTRNGIPDPESHGADNRDPAGHAEGLNPQQAAAVLHDHGIGGPALVLAGAGSGKTTVLARRIARQALLDGGGAHILALTFTKEAAGEMEERVKGLLAGGPGKGLSLPLSMPRFGTFHAFAYRLVRSEAAGVPNWRRLGFSRCPSLLEPSAQAAWLAGLRDQGFDGASPESLARLLADPFGPDPEEGKEPVPGTAALRLRYRNHLLAEGSLAFDDMVALAIRLLRDHPEAMADAQDRTRRILVDEFQDTSPDQLDLVKLLLRDGRSLFLVGDDDQAIYGFRGADPGNIDRARELFPGLRILKLETNYRSTAPIVDYANAVFQGKPEHLRKVLRPGRPAPSGRKAAPVAVHVHDDGPTQGAWMIAEMRRLIREEGLAWKDMAVLYRLNVLERYYRSLVASLAGEKAAAEVVFATVHASKGLQWPAVFLVGLEDGVLPYRPRGEAADAARLAEERRIFYVGVTRAERHLHLCAVRKRMLRGRIREWKPSPFLAGRRTGAAAAPVEGRKARSLLAWIFGRRKG